MKTCDACGHTKPVDEFYKNARMRDGRLRQCKQCVSERQRAYKEANRERVRAAQREYTQATRGRKRAYDVGYRTANRELITARKLQELDRLRADVFSHYGEACACCGSTDRLNIDHIAGGGTAHRKQIRRTGIPFYRWLKLNDFPDGYQTLCWPCNASKFTGSACRLVHAS